jgi:multidrug efflux pump subunit AcrA (membrane-fusion protein)
MKKSFINNKLLAGLIFLMACKEPKQEHPGHNQTASPDTGLTALAKPVNEQVLSAMRSIKAEQGKRLYMVSVPGLITYDTRKQVSVAARVAGRIERLYVHYNNQPVQKGQLLWELYSPDLVAGQRELLLLQRTGTEPALLEGAKQKLQLLGMSVAAINKVLANGEPMYRIPVYSPATGYILDVQNASVPSAITLSSSSIAGGAAGMAGMGGETAGGSTENTATTAPATSSLLVREGQYLTSGQSVFTIYQNTGLIAEFAFAPAISKVPVVGKKLLFYPVGDSANAKTGSIRLIQPVFTAGQNFTLTRMNIPSKEYRVGQLLRAELAVASTEGWWLPREAVLDLGNRSIVFRKEQGLYKPVTVQTGIRANGHVQVLENISDWLLASNAYYLVDSESFIPDTKLNN